MNQFDFSSFTPFSSFPEDDAKINDNNLSFNEITKTPFLFLKGDQEQFNRLQDTAIKGQHTRNELSKIFFSQDNIKRLQKMIKKEIYSKTNGKFKMEAEQDTKDLFVAMRAVYYEHASYIPNGVIRQVKRLNRKVLEQIIPDMLTSIKQNYGYQLEINRPLRPLPLPENVGNKGRKTLPSITTLWNI